MDAESLIQAFTYTDGTLHTCPFYDVDAVKWEVRCPGTAKLHNTIEVDNLELARYVALLLNKSFRAGEQSKLAELRQVLDIKNV